MQSRQLVLRGLAYFWRTNAAVVAGVATAVAVLSGALLVGDSVRGSLRDLVLQRLGRTDRVVASSGFFREALADDIRADPAFSTAGFENVCPIIASEGLVRDQASGRRASRVQVYGIDDRFWRFHGRPEGRGPEGRDALQRLYLSLNPLQLRHQLDAALERLWALATPAAPLPTGFRP